MGGGTGVVAMDKGGERAGGTGGGAAGATDRNSPESHATNVFGSGKGFSSFGGGGGLGGTNFASMKPPSSNAE